MKGIYCKNNLRLWRSVTKCGCSSTSSMGARVIKHTRISYSNKRYWIERSWTLKPKSSHFDDFLTRKLSKWKYVGWLVGWMYGWTLNLKKFVVNKQPTELRRVHGITFYIGRMVLWTVLYLLSLMFDCQLHVQLDDQIPKSRSVPVHMPYRALTAPEPGRCYRHRPGSGPVKAGYGIFTCVCVCVFCCVIL